jgi:uncharacterized protein YndB with AHSA1/START domain
MVMENDDQNNKSGSPDEISVTVTRELGASPAQVFDAWITPATIGKFMYGPQLRDETVVHLLVDARLGGTFSFKVIRNGQAIDHVGEYLVFDRPGRLSFTWGIAGESAGGSTVVIDLIPTDKGCKLTLTHKLDPAWKEYADRTEKGWNLMLDKLRETLEAKSGTPTVTAQMLIRKPASVVFEAFIDPEITRNFWFTKGSGKLEAGKTITWEWEMYGFSAPVQVEEIVPEKLIVIRWGDPATTIRFAFQELPGGTTYVVITNTGFTEEGDALLAAINDNAGGFTTVLDGAKAYLEHHINLNLIADKFPKELTQHTR